MQSNEPNVTTGGHPSGLNLSSIPATKDVDAKPQDGPEPSVKGVLRELAVAFQAAMRRTADSFARNCAALQPEAAAKCEARYFGLHECYATVKAKWDELEFDGEPQPEKVWGWALNHALAIQQERQQDTAF